MRISSRLLLVPAIVALIALVAACSDDDGEPNAVTITGTEFSFKVAEGDLTPGVNTITFDNAGSVDHHMQIFQLSTGKTTDDLVEAMSDPTAAPPSWALPLGGVSSVSSGLSGKVTLDLREGTYALICFLEASDGVPHFLKGMAAELSVEGSEVAADAPDESVTIKGFDYGFEAPETIPAGEITFRYTNEGQDLHELVLARVPAGADVSEDDLISFFASEDAPPPFEPFPPTFYGGVQGIIPGASQLATLDLEAGDYVLLCLIPNAEGVPHAGLRMVRKIRVE